MPDAPAHHSLIAHDTALAAAAFCRRRCPLALSTASSRPHGFPDEPKVGSSGLKVHSPLALDDRSGRELETFNVPGETESQRAEP